LSANIMTLSRVFMLGWDIVFATSAAMSPMREVSWWIASLMWLESM
jgi:hypothetical protein